MMLTTILTEPADGAARMADAKLFGRVSTGLAETFFASGKVQPIVKSRVRYPRLEPGTVITEAALGRALIERGAEKARRPADGAARMADAKLFGRVSTGLAETFFASGKVQPIVKSRVRYPRLEPGTVITEAALGRITHP